MSPESRSLFRVYRAILQLGFWLNLDPGSMNTDPKPCHPPSVVDPDTLNFDQDAESCPNSDPDPGPSDIKYSFICSLTE